ncbi:MAG: hypothetical protein R2790_07430 [Flavobacterium haoranii]
MQELYYLVGQCQVVRWRFSNTGSGNHIGNNGTITGLTISGGYFAWIDDSTRYFRCYINLPLIDVSTLTSPTLFF